VILHDLQYSRARSPPGLRRWVFPAKLSDAESRANTVFDRFGERQQIPFRRAHPIQRLLTESRLPHQPFIPVLGYHGPARGGPCPFDGTACQGMNPDAPETFRLSPCCRPVTVLPAFRSRLFPLPARAASEVPRVVESPMEKRRDCHGSSPGIRAVRPKITERLGSAKISLYQMGKLCQTDRCEVPRHVT